MVLPLPVNLWQMFNSLNPGPEAFQIGRNLPFLADWGVAAKQQVFNKSIPVLLFIHAHLPFWSFPYGEIYLICHPSQLCSRSSHGFSLFLGSGDISSSALKDSALVLVHAQPQPGLRVCSLSSLSSSFSLPLECPVPSFHRAVPISFLLPGRRFPFFFLSYLLVILSSEATFSSRSDVLMLSSPGPMYFSSLETTAVVFLRVCNLMTCYPPHTSSFCFLYPAQCLSSSNTDQYLWNHWIFCMVDLLLDHGGRKHASLHAERRNVQWGCLSSLCVSWDPCVLFGTYSIRLKSQTFLLD